MKIKQFSPVVIGAIGAFLFTPKSIEIDSKKGMDSVTSELKQTKSDYESIKKQIGNIYELKNTIDEEESYINHITGINKLFAKYDKINAYLNKNKARYNSLQEKPSDTILSDEQLKFLDDYDQNSKKISEMKPDIEFLVQEYYECSKESCIEKLRNGDGLKYGLLYTYYGQDD